MMPKKFWYKCGICGKVISSHYSGQARTNAKHHILNKHSMTNNDLMAKFKNIDKIVKTQALERLEEIAKE